MSDAERIEVGSMEMKDAFRDGVENYVPTMGGHEMEEEGGVTHVSLANLREMVSTLGNPACLEVGENQVMLISWIPFNSFLATGFSIGYRGTGPTGLATFASEVGWGKLEELRREIGGLAPGFRGPLFPRERRLPDPPLKLEAYNEIVAFGRHLQEDKGWSAKQLIHYFEKPWKWEPEYNEWRAR